MSLSLPSSDSSFVACKGHLDRVEASTTISSSGYRGFIVSSPIILEDFPLLTVYDWVDNGICEYYSKYKFSSSICKFVDINPVLDKDSPDDVVSLDKVGHLNNACHGPKGYDGDSFYMYSTLLTHLHIVLPFNNFTMGVLHTLNVARA